MAQKYINSMYFLKLVILPWLLLIKYLVCMGDGGQHFVV